ncbi:Hypothetical predicted protein [Pelobates cultripes]|uniref:Uncharacterized protein n=1 Tax=Pelobates cultripes TaxID=61616 RepID=A0AAD1RE12_PELCU|nr:Hypothetical predicted protein [Pelobates cultripes]
MARFTEVNLAAFIFVGFYSLQRCEVQLYSTTLYLASLPRMRNQQTFVGFFVCGKDARYSFVLCKALPRIFSANEKPTNVRQFLNRGKDVRYTFTQYKAVPRTSFP